MDNDAANKVLESGIPPNWFPPDKKIDFRGKLRDLLKSMTLDDLREDAEGIIGMHREHFADPNYLRHGYRAEIINGIPDTVGHDLAILARYLYATALGPGKGLEVLIGTEAAAKVQATERRDEILAEGRKKGVKERQKNAEDNKANLLKAISALFDNPEKPGWNWTNNEITEFLAKSSTAYKKNTIRQTVKREAARYRKARKEE